MLPEGVSKSVPAERRADDVAKVESGVKLAGAAGDVARDIGVLVARVSRIETILGLGVSNALKVDTIDAIASTPAPETRFDDAATTTLAATTAQGDVVVPTGSAGQSVDVPPATGAHFIPVTTVLPDTATSGYVAPFPAIPPDSPPATTVPLNAPGTLVHSTGDASQPATESVQAFLDNPNVPEAIKAAVRAGQGLIGGV